MAKKYGIFKVVMLTLLAIIAAGVAVGMWSRTLVGWWVVPSMAAIPAVGIGLASSTFMSRLTGSAVRLLNAGIMWAIMTAVLSAAALTVNYTGADDATDRTVEATVIAKHRKEHQERRRSGRRTYLTGKKYYTYELTLQLPDGRTKDQAVSAKAYSRIRTGSIRRLHIQRGLFGLDVIKPAPKPTE